VVFLPKDGATVEVSGETECRSTLDLIAGGRVPDGPQKPKHVAALLPEPSSPSDPNAIRVVIIPTMSGLPWGKVGYLFPEDAVRYRPVIDRVASIGKVTVCHVSLKGGRDRGPEEQAYIGVTLHLDTPENLMLDIDKKLRA
jgi:hypothetical protein